MKKNYLLIAILIMVSVANAFAAGAKLSPTAMKLKKELLNKQSVARMSYAPIAKVKGEECVMVLCKISTEFDIEAAERMGCRIGTNLKSIITISVPLSRFVEFTEVDGVLAVEAETIAAPHMDVARTVVHATEVNSGTSPLAKPYTGKGVLIGVIDAGFDYSHPAFYDSVNHKLKIIRVWEQGTEGEHQPLQFGYGRELFNDQEILASGSDHPFFSHGTHVAAITAGQPEPTQGKYTGIAPDAELLIVGLKMPRPSIYSYETAAVNFIDAYAYLFNYADSAHKPMIVNLSWGLPIDSKDGKSLFSQALELLTGKGKIAAVSAGNDGDSKIHCYMNFDTDTTHRTYTTHPSNMTGSPKRIWLDFWGEPGKDFSVKLSIIANNVSRKVVAETEFIDMPQDGITNRSLIYNGDTVSVEFIVTPSAQNGKPHTIVLLEGKKKQYFQIDVRAKSGSVHISNWARRTDGYFTAVFTSLSDTTATDGTTDYTISDWGCGKSVIAVGAVATKKTFINEAGDELSYSGIKDLGEIASFSSHGPTNDGGIKPDICAPGFAVVSAVNSLDTAYFAKGPSASSVILHVDHLDKKYPYGIMAGTSMSCPVVSGCIALMLEADSTLTPGEVLSYLKRNAIHDSFTGEELPNNIWGSGKINLFASIKDVLGVLPATDEQPKPEMLAYPNPASENVRVMPLGFGQGRAILYNALGTAVSSSQCDLSKPEIYGLSSLPAGAYYLVIETNGKEVFRTKLLIEPK